MGRVSLAVNSSDLQHAVCAGSRIKTETDDIYSKLTRFLLFSPTTQLLTRALMLLGIHGTFHEARQEQKVKRLKRRREEKKKKKKKGIA